MSPAVPGFASAKQGIQWRCKKNKKTKQKSVRLLNLETYQKLTCHVMRDLLKGYEKNKIREEEVREEQLLQSLEFVAHVEPNIQTVELTAGRKRKTKNLREHRRSAWRPENICSHSTVYCNSYASSVSLRSRKKKTKRNHSSCDACL